NGFVLLTGTVAAPEDSAEAERLVTAFVGEGTRVISRLQTATPLQVNLQVRIAEVNRSIVKQIGGNLLTRDTDGNGILFGAFRGRTAGTLTDQTLPTAVFPGSTAPVYYNPLTGQPVSSIPVTATINPLVDAASFALGGRMFGINLLGVLDMAERSGMVATLAQPNLTTVSGETADFLAGGEYPIPVPDPATGSITIEYRKFGVSLAYTPTVLSNGRISLRVRPEVSELSTEGAIRLNGIEVPALSIRRAETTVELGSGESFMIAGLMSNRSVGAVDSTPGVGDMPILGTLFRSDNFRRGDTELVIVVTPYLVRPVSADQIVLPTDGFRNPTDIQRSLLNGIADGQSGATRPGPTLETAPATPAGNTPSRPGVIGMTNPTPAAPAASERPARTRNGRTSANAAPGFSFHQ
ncbi:MAG: type II and III secretion system protein family protein, partial [Sphingopyxis sp.]